MIVIILVCSTLMVFLAMGIDVGRALSRKQQLSNACDAAAIGGGSELPNASRASTAATQVLAATFSSPIYTVTTSSADVRTTASEAVPTTFARLAGMSSITVSASARVVRPATPANEMTGGITPWAIEQAAYAPGTAVTLKLGGGSGSGGNFYALALGGSGATVYQNNIMFGYAGTLGAGDQLSADTEPGAMTGPTKSAVNYRIGLATSNPAYAPDTASSYSGTNPRILEIAMVQSWVDVSGKTQVQITGFAAVYLVGMQGNDVQGVFVSASTGRVSVSGSRPAGADYQVNPVRLVE